MNTESNSNAKSALPVAEATQRSITTATDAIPVQDLTPPQLDTIGGGSGSGGYGGVWLNHNETTASDSDAAESTASVDTVDTTPAQDLTPTQTDAVKGGPGTGGGIWLNHNETVTSDSDEDDCTASGDTVDTTPAQDLTPPQLDTINGGGPGLVLQHNETAASDSDADEPAPAASVDPVDAIPAQDLTPPQLDAIKGGPDFSILLNGGGLKFNHNETAASDETQAA